MTIKQTISKVSGAFLVFAFVLGGVFAVNPVAVHAQDDAGSECGGIKTAILTCGGEKDATDPEDTGVWHLLIVAINILTAGVGVLALAGIVWGSVLYTSAGGNPEQVKKAKNIFVNVAIGVIAFAGMYALLNFIVPGGVFN